MGSKIFTPGARVRFVDPLNYERWFIQERAGVVVESRQYGLVEPMVTVRFGGIGVHISGRSLKIEDDG